MKKIIGLILIMLMLSSCSNIYNLDNFVMPDDLEFLQVVKELDTPEKIGSYMENNFEYDGKYVWKTLSPYELWKVKKGVCGDFATFGVFVADYHGYETYFVIIHFDNLVDTHAIAIYQEDNNYTYSSNYEYFPLHTESIDKVIKHYDIYEYRYKVERYKVVE